jgi:hypothetical protein
MDESSDAEAPLRTPPEGVGGIGLHGRAQRCGLRIPAGREASIADAAGGGGIGTLIYNVSASTRFGVCRTPDRPYCDRRHETNEVSVLRRRW